MVAVLLVAGCFPLRAPAVFEIPAGYRGWVEIDFERSDCQPLPKRDGHLVLSITPEGTLCTSSKFEEGWARDKYYYAGTPRRKLEVTGWSEGGLIWAGTYTGKGDGRSKDRYYRFFVGTEAEYKA